MTVNNFLLRLFSYRYSKQIAYGLMILCGFWILLNLIQICSILFYRPVSQSTLASSSESQPTTPHLATQISSWHLLGNTAPKAINLNQLPLSSANLTLNGIFYESDHRLSQALISDASGNSKLYKTGDIVPGGITLYDILPDSIILQSNGQLEKLTLPGRELNFAPPPQGLP